MKKALFILSLAGSIVLIAVAVAYSPEGDADHGKEVFAMQKCAMCHSIAGAGGSKLALDGVGSRLNSEDIKKWIKTPRQMKAGTTMKSYPNLPEKDLKDLTAFLLTLK